MATAPTERLDLDACAREPIHKPGSIQPYGALFVLSPDDLTIRQAAIGSVRLRRELLEVVGKPLGEILPDNAGSLVRDLRQQPPGTGVAFLGIVRFDGQGSDAGYHMLAHRSGDAIVVELEEFEAGNVGSLDILYPSIRGFLTELETVASIEELGGLAARQVRRLTGFDRVLVYRFDEAWNGTVIAEDRNDVLPSYLDLRFPAADIPAQARELYRLNRLRLIADADYLPVPIEPAGTSIDLSFAALRSVSPVHLEYMRNMGTWASMSISLMQNGGLWGLISCHNRDPHRVAYHVRTACDFIGQTLSLQIAGQEQAALADRRLALRAVQARLLAHLAGEDHYIDGLVRHPEELLTLTGAGGAAIVSGGTCALLGETPTEAEVREIAAWLAERTEDDLFSTECLAAEMPAAAGMKAYASGVLAISISKLHASYILWFRPEVVRTVKWGGEPAKPERKSGDARLHPRKSFEIWRETVSSRSIPWHEAERDAAVELRTAIVDIVLRRAEEVAALNDQLVRSNKELEAFSYSVSHDLRAPFRHIVGYSQLLRQYEGDKLSQRGNRFIDTIIESAISAGTLVDDLLSFSQMARATLNPITIDMDQLVREVRSRFAMDVGDRSVEWRIGTLAPTRGDPMMLRLVLQNLLDNAIKFTNGREKAVIEIGCDPGKSENVYFVRDNGAGFDMAYVGKLFGVFQRLHRVEDYEGTGIGLANVKRIVDRHGGRAWAEGEVEQGATFFFALPNRKGVV